MASTKAYEYDVALSFAGEDRRLAEELAHRLGHFGLRIFYDRDQQATLWGKDLYQHLQEIYRDKARFCVIFISASYVRKHWPRHELKQAQARALIESREYILPLRIDDTDVPGMNRTTGELDLRSMSMDFVSKLLFEKLKQESGAPFTSPDPGANVEAIHWSAVPGPYGGSPRAIALHPTDPASLVVGFEAEFGIFRSFDAGSTWIPWSTGLTDLRINALAFVPPEGQSLWAGTDSGLFVSRNALSPWSGVDYLRDKDVRTISVSPENPGLIYCGTGKHTGGVSISAGTAAVVSSDHPIGLPVSRKAEWVPDPSQGHLHRSLDGGHTWTTMGDLGSVNSLCMPPADPLRIYVGTSDQGVFWSEDGGNTWANFPDRYPSKIFGLAVAPEDPSFLVAGTSDGAALSHDSARTWQRLDLPGSRGIAAIAFGTSPPFDCYAGTRYGVYRSADRGETWERFDRGLRHSRAMAITLDQGGLFAGTDGGGLYRRRSHQAAWLPVSNLPAPLGSIDGIEASEGTLLVGTPAGLYRSENGGASWQCIGDFDLEPVWSIAIDRREASDSSATLPKTKTWSPVRILYAGTTGGKIYQTLDAGSSWKTLTTLPGKQVLRLAAAFRAPGGLYAVCATKGLFYRAEQEETWHDLSGHGPGALVQSLETALNSDQQEILFAGTGEGAVWATVDGGVTWKHLGEGLPAAPVMSIQAIGGGAELYVALQGGGVYWLEPGASRWRCLNGDLSCLDVIDLTVLDPEKGALLAGTKTGIFASLRGSGRWHREVAPSPGEPHVNRFFPVQGGKEWIACTSRRLLRCSTADILSRLSG
jgi:photosystem II stability/assembly factor-like uncharacterized protein